MMLRSALIPSKLIGVAGGTPRRRHRRPWAAAIILLLLIATLVLAHRPWNNLASRDQLAQTALVGERGPGCLRLLVASDNSGSMAAIAGPRDHAVRQLLTWAPDNLIAADQIGVIEFAGSAATALPPASASRPGTLEPAFIDLQGTLLTPLLAEVRTLPPSRCRTVLVVIGDGLFYDLPSWPSQARRQLQDAGIYQLALLVPGRSPVGLRWRLLYPEAVPVRFDGNDPNDTAFAIAQQVAAVTGQRLVERR